MELVLPGDRRTTAYGGAFTGDVELELLREAPSADQPDVARVHFQASATTYWHRHPGGQALLLLEGGGEVGTGTERHALAPGAFVVAPAGERHWHGAAAGQSCVFLALTWGTTEWEGQPPPTEEVHP